MKRYAIFEKMEPNGSRYKENNVGERIDPCGTPQERCAAGLKLFLVAYLYTVTRAGLLADCSLLLIPNT